MQFYQKITSSLDNWVTTIGQKYKAISSKSWFNPLVVIFIGSGFFLVSYFLILRSNPYFNGDVGLVGIMADDIRNGRFFGWYFYGQTYLGLVWPAILGLLTLPTGMSFEIMVFWEHFCYALALILIALRIRWPSPFLSLFYFPVLLFLHPFYSYTYSQTYSSILLIFAVFFYLFDKFWVNKVTPNRNVWFVTGFFGALALFHYPAYIIILPIFGLLVLAQWIIQKVKWKWTGITFAFFGYCLGLIPFILAGISTNWQNLAWYTGSGTSGSRNLVLSVKYYLSEYLTYFIVNRGTPYPLGIEGYQDTLWWLLTDSRNLAGALLSGIISVAIIYSIFKWRNYAAHLVFVGFMFLILAGRGTDGRYEIFSNVRYSMNWHVIWVSLGMRSLFENSRWNGRIGQIASVFLIIFVGITSLFAVSTIAVQQQAPYRQPHTYKVIFEDLKARNVEYLYCYNYFELCGQLAFLAHADNDSVTVQLFDSNKEGSSNRNPSTRGVVDKAVQEGKTVYSLVPEFLIWSVEGKYEPLVNFSYHGIKRYGLFDKPVICAANEDPEGINPDNGLFLKNCGTLENQFNVSKSTL